MTNEQINKAIAKAVGWESETSGPSWYEYETKMPNYAGCLNAMHEAECWLADRYPATYELYCREVSKVAHYPITIAAIVRAKLFVKTLGKWEEKV